MRLLSDVAAALASDATAQAHIGCSASVSGGTLMLGASGAGVDGNHIGAAYFFDLGGTPDPAGDLNCDGGIDFDDIDPFVLALSGQAAYEAAYPDCDWLNADINGNGSVDFDDIDPFVALLSGG